MFFTYVLFLSFGLSFALTFVSTHFLIGILRKRKIVGVDGHKLSRPEVPEMGGLAVLLGFSAALLVCSLSFLTRGSGYDVTPILAVLGVFLMAGAVGFIDDLYKLHHHIKPLLLLAAALPLILLKAGMAEIRLPFITVDFTSFMGHDISMLYWLIVVPIAVTGAANVSNMLAGFNGLMSGMAVISCGALALIAAYSGQPTMALVFATMVGAQLAFHYFNRCPARIFPGDTGTLSFGALIAAGVIAGNLQFFGFLVFLPQILNASMSLLSVGAFFEEKQFRSQKLAALKMSPDGLISFTRLEKPITLCKLLLYGRPQTESMLVFKVCILSFISSLLACLLAVVWG